MLLLREEGPRNSRFVVALKRIRGRRDPGFRVSLQTSRATGRGRRLPRHQLDRRSLSQTSEQFRVLIDELFYGSEKR